MSIRQIVPSVRSALSARLAPVALVVITALVLIYALLALSTGDPLQATSSLLTGPLSDSGRTSQWLNDTTDLMLTGLAVALAFRAGQFSLGAEGQVALGALAAGAVLLHLGDVPGAWIIGLVVGALAGFLFGLVPGLMKAYGGADEIVSTLMLNYIALLFFAFAINQWLQPDGAGYPVSDFLDASAWMPTFGLAPKIPLGLFIAVALCVLAWFFLGRTRVGFELRMTGENPRFATAVGLRVNRSIWMSIAVSGAVAGLAGAIIMQTETHRLILGLSGNLGYDGILVALIATNRPLLIPVGALGYAYLRTGGDIAQITSNVPRELITTVQGVLILIVTAKFTPVGGRLKRLGNRLFRREPAVSSLPEASVS
jgi:simple sugar transport system permease protein